MFNWLKSQFEVIVGTITAIALNPDTLQVLEAEYYELYAQMPEITWDIFLNQKLPSLIYVALSVLISYSFKQGLQKWGEERKAKQNQDKKGGESDQ